MLPYHSGGFALVDMVYMSGKIARAAPVSRVVLQLASQMLVASHDGQRSSKYLTSARGAHGEVVHY